MYQLTLKITLALISLYLYNVIINSEYLQVPDTNFKLVTCNPVPEGYEYGGIIINVPNLINHSSKKCWYGCYPNTGCKISLEQPGIYGYTTRFLMAIIVSINIFIFTNYY